MVLLCALALTALTSPDYRDFEVPDDVIYRRMRCFISFLFICGCVLLTALAVFVVSRTRGRRLILVFLVVLFPEVYLLQYALASLLARR